MDYLSLFMNYQNPSQNKNAECAKDPSTFWYLCN